jgi:hypothetical protein
MIQHMVVKCSLFLCCGLVEKHTGTDDLDNLGGVLRRDTWLGVLFFVAALSLVGLPPLSGFFGKLVIIQAGWTPAHWWLSVLGLATGALTLLSMMKIWSYGFWHPPDAPTAMAPTQVKRSSKGAYLGIVMLVGSALFLGFGAEPVYRIAFNAGKQLANPRYYIAAVLGEEAVPEDYRSGTEFPKRLSAPVPNSDTSQNETNRMSRDVSTRPNWRSGTPSVLDQHLALTVSLRDHFARQPLLQRRRGRMIDPSNTSRFRQERETTTAPLWEPQP